MLKPEDKICVRCGIGKREARAYGEAGMCSVYGKHYGRHDYMGIEKCKNVKPIGYITYSKWEEIGEKYHFFQFREKKRV